MGQRRAARHGPLLGERPPGPGEAGLGPARLLGPMAEERFLLPHPRQPTCLLPTHPQELCQDRGMPLRQRWIREISFTNKSIQTVGLFFSLEATGQWCRSTTSRAYGDVPTSPQGAATGQRRFLQKVASHRVQGPSIACSPKPAFC